MKSFVGDAGLDFLLAVVAENRGLTPKEADWARSQLFSCAALCGPNVLPNRNISEKFEQEVGELLTDKKTQTLLIGKAGDVEPVPDKIWVCYDDYHPDHGVGDWRYHKEYGIWDWTTSGPEETENKGEWIKRPDLPTKENNKAAQAGFKHLFLEILGKKKMMHPFEEFKKEEPDHHI